MSFLAAAADIADELIALRRELHRDPEVGLHTPRTRDRVLAALAGLPLEITLGVECTSVVAVLRGGQPGPVVLLRGDMDGLPVEERTGVDFASTNGAMHACGHDIHTAGLVGAARLLSARQAELPGTVIFMFQPGEERVGGARVMLAEGVLDAAAEPPVAAYALHVENGPLGQFSTRPGPLLGSSNELRVTMHGKGGHGSQPETSVDPVPALVEYAQALQTMVTRRFSVFDPVVVTVTQLQAGDAINVIPETARLGATLRALTAATTERLGQEAARLAESIAAGHGCRAEVDYKIDYPVTTNDAAEAEFVLATLTDMFGRERVERRPIPEMGAEDFSYVMQQVPGAYFYIRTTPPDMDPATAPAPHSAEAVFDDSVLPHQAAALAELAWRRLQRR